MTRIRPSAEKHVACPNDLHRTVLEQQPKRSVGIESGKAPADLLLLAQVNAEPRTDQVSAVLPCPHDRGRLARTPETEQTIERAGKQRRERLRLHPAIERRNAPVGKIGSRGEIDAEAEDHAVRTALEQDSGELLARQHQIVGPLEGQRLAGRRGVERFDQRKAGHQGERLRWRIVGAQPDDRTAVEITLDRDPLAALAALARALIERNEPLALDRSFIRKKVGIGRAGAVDDPDSAQKSDPAARSVSEPKRPISR